jgi:anti-sigma-K factor RskA
MMPMHDLLAPYLLGSLDPDEHEAFVGHLLECAQCQAELADLEGGLANLVDANAVAPPPGLRESVLASVSDGAPAHEPEVTRRESKRSWNSLVLGAAAVVVLFVGLLAILGPNSVDEIVDASDASVVALATSDAFQGTPPPTAQVVFSADQEGAVVEIDGLAPPSGSNVYEMWLIGDDGPVPAGTFVPGTDGSVLVRMDGTAQPGLVVGITEEPSGGSAAPTGDVLFSAEL